MAGFVIGGSISAASSVKDSSGSVDDAKVLLAARDAIAAEKKIYIYNGNEFDCVTPGTLGCDGMMVGRGAVGNPFLFAEIRAALAGQTYIPPTPKERMDTALFALRLAVEEKGEREAVLSSRKQFADYASGLRGASALRASAHRAETYAEMETLAREFLSADND